MKILFLDIDGVLNTDRSHSRPGGTSDIIIPRLQSVPGAPQIYLNEFDPVAVANLNKITDATGAKIIISSTWREPFVRYGIFSALKEYLQIQGVKGDVVGFTPTTPEYRGLYGYEKMYNRGKEIELYLHRRLGKENDIESYVIIDDDESVGEIEQLNRHWVQTFWLEGITEADVEKAIRILNISIY